MHKIIVTRDKRGLGSSGAYKLIKKAASAALDAENIAQECIINVLLTDESAIQEINLEYRGVDSATDVLSFPQNDFRPGRIDYESAVRDMESGDIMLGDMVLCLSRARSQAEEYGHSEDREISYLTVHSVLHLLGYDHVDEGEQKRLMRSREDEIMKIIGIER